MKAKNIKTICLSGSSANILEEDINKELGKFPDYSLVDIKYSCSTSIALQKGSDTMQEECLFSALIILDLNPLTLADIF